MEIVALKGSEVLMTLIVRGSEDPSDQSHIKLKSTMHQKFLCRPLTEPLRVKKPRIIKKP